jgi:hypothetical protein
VDAGIVGRRHPARGGVAARRPLVEGAGIDGFRGHQLAGCEVDQTRLDMAVEQDIDIGDRQRLARRHEPGRDQDVLLHVEPGVGRLAGSSRTAVTATTAAQTRQTASANRPCSAAH